MPLGEDPLAWWTPAQELGECFLQVLDSLERLRELLLHGDT